MEDKVFLSLGSNLGDRCQHLDHACKLINRDLGEIVSKSSVYETKPWGDKQLSQFLNIIVQLRTKLSPQKLLKGCQEIEQEMGRDKGAKALNRRYQDRRIDIDIIFYGCEVIQTEELKVPHPLMHQRAFVLFPLEEIASDYQHPIDGLTVRRMKENLFDQDSVQLFFCKCDSLFLKARNNKVL